MDELGKLNELQDDLEDALDAVKGAKFKRRMVETLGWRHYDSMQAESMDKDEEYAARLERQRRILDYTKNGTPYPEYEAEKKESIKRQKAAQEEFNRNMCKHNDEHLRMEAEELLERAVDRVVQESDSENAPITHRDK